MKVLVVLCHPNTSGFNHAIAQSIVKNLSKGHEVQFLDLYREDFDPILPQAEIQRKFSFDEVTLRYFKMVKDAEVYVFIHPDWWGAPPALLKGFIDRVFRPGVAYEYEGTEFLSKAQTKLLRGKKAFVFNTTDYKKPDGLYPPAEIWKTNIFGYCGIPDAQVHTFFDTYNSTYEERHQWILNAGPQIQSNLGS